MESIYSYFHQAYDEFPHYPKNDRKELALNVLCTLERSPGSSILPEDVPFLIEYLNVPDDKIIRMDSALDDYFDQFDLTKRCNEELSHRYEVLRQQRIEAIEKDEPLPIKPMGVELDMCYKKSYR